MEAKLIYPKWINGKAQIEFPKSPITGQIFKFIDQSKLDWEVWEVQAYFYTGDKWVKMKTQDSVLKDKVQSATISSPRMRKIKA